MSLIRNIHTVAETESTNDDVAELAREGWPEGTWLRAGRQTGGKGRQGREWRSPGGNLYASTLVRLLPGDPPAPTLALVAAVALQEVARRHAPEVRIKWPNDLLVEGAKVAGILLERHGDAVVIGFGVNLATHPEDLGRPATSLGTPVAPDAFLERLATALRDWLTLWRKEGFATVRAAWLRAAHPAGTPLVSNGAEGVFEGLDESGALRLRLADGSIRLIHAGDVFLL
ncbi:MAG TPA: biotin--[acetyl-CoA-carboxylase] ligase [Allosphingosinicella sp.]|nr:biotin--[acetyl-CoA-carboxylase] ligase [Allosphingosinicella sp.]